MAKSSLSAFIAKFLYFKPPGVIVQDNEVVFSFQLQQIGCNPFLWTGRKGGWHKGFFGRWLIYKQMYSRVQARFPPWHTFLCKNWQVRGPTFFMSLQRILIQLHIIAKFGIIDQAVRFFCCLNKKIGKACIRCIYQNLVIWISVWHLPTTGVVVFQIGNNDAFFYFVAFKNPCYREVLAPSDITEKKKKTFLI